MRLGRRDRDTRRRGRHAKGDRVGEGTSSALGEDERTAFCPFKRISDDSLRRTKSVIQGTAMMPTPKNRSWQRPAFNASSAECQRRAQNRVQSDLGTMPYHALTPAPGDRTSDDRSR